MASDLYNDDVVIDTIDDLDNTINSSSNVSDDSSNTTPPSVTPPAVNPINVSDNTSRIVDGWIKNTTDTGGTPGETYNDTPPTELPPLTPPVYKTVTRTIQEIITNYDQTYLQQLAEQGGKFYVYYTDGTRDEVEYTEIIDPYVIQTQTLVLEVDAITQANNQHFWHDNNGAHVTDETRDSWEENAAYNFSDLSDNNNHNNLLMNSYGLVIRRALKNLAAFSRSGVTFYDGDDNNANNIVALFGKNSAQIGKSTESHMSLTSSGIDFYKNSQNVASFGSDGARVGPSTESNVTITNDSFKMDVGNGFIPFEIHGGVPMQEVVYSEDGQAYYITSLPYIYSNATPTYIGIRSFGVGTSEWIYLNGDFEEEYLSSADEYQNKYNMHDVRLVYPKETQLSNGTQVTIDHTEAMTYSDFTDTITITDCAYNRSIIAQYGYLVFNVSDKEYRLLTPEEQTDPVRNAWEITEGSNTVNKMVWNIAGRLNNPVYSYSTKPNYQDVPVTPAVIIDEDTNYLYNYRNGNDVLLRNTIESIDWFGNDNLVAIATDDNQEWSIDLTPQGHTGTYWHVWTPLKGTMLKCDVDSGDVTIPYTAYINRIRNKYNGTRGTTPSSDQWINSIEYVDQNDARVGVIEMSRLAAGRSELWLRVSDNTGQVQGGLRIRQVIGGTTGYILDYDAASGRLEVPVSLRIAGRTTYDGSSIEFYPPANNSNYGGFIDFHYNQSTADYTSRIWENASGRITITGADAMWKEGATVGLSVKSSNVNQASPSGDKWTCPTTLYDSAGNLIGHDEYYQNSAGTLTHNFAAVRQKVNGTWHWYQCSMAVQTNGTVTYGIHTPANFRSAIGAQVSGNYAPHGWTQKASNTNDNAMTYSLSGCTEVMFAAMAGTTYLGSVILPVSLLHASTYREVYLSGGRTSTGGRAFALKATTTRSTVAARIQDTGAVACTWWVFAR